jgi:predicted RNA-binding Zn ribbon-like protein
MKVSRWNSKASWNTPAPGELELVRRFLNSWRIDDSTRQPADELPWLLGDRRAWEERFPRWPLSPEDTEDLLARLREDLRETLVAPEGWTERLNTWLGGYPLVAHVVEEDQGASVQYEPALEANFAGQVLATVARSVEEGTFSRLKACPDCQWVFYDKTRSRTRVWCGMYAGDGGRACGTISKVRRYRQRRKAGG